MDIIQVTDPFYGSRLGRLSNIVVTRSTIHMVSTTAKASSKDSPAEGMGGEVDDICTYIAPNQLLSEYGGVVEWKWNFTQYWSEIEIICAKQ